jgi:glutamate dehydrogenase/leucine dehydrogenase
MASPPGAVAEALRAEPGGLAWAVRNPLAGGYRASTPRFGFLAEFLAGDSQDVHGHEAIFLGVGQQSGALFGAVVHSTRRGQAQGGVRRWEYPSLETFVRDGLRLAQAMTRKNALAHLWWGGGKGLIACDAGAHVEDPSFRRALYREYGSFVSALRGCYVTAEDVGTRPDDMAEIATTTRFATCLPADRGGRGDPSTMTAAGVARAIDAALAFRGEQSVAGLRVAVQGGGNTGSALVAELLARDAGRIVVAERSSERCERLRAVWTGRPVAVRHATPGDATILAEACDVLAPCALGGVLDATTIPEIKARIVCGSANNPLADDDRDAARLAERNITFVPDVVANRMGIVYVCNEQYGSLDDDDELTRHLDGDWEGGIFATTLRVLEDARTRGITPQAAALERADALAEQEHPIFGHRGWRIVEGLCRGTG